MRPPEALPNTAAVREAHPRSEKTLIGNRVPLAQAAASMTTGVLAKSATYLSCADRTSKSHGLHAL